MTQVVFLQLLLLWMYALGCVLMYALMVIHKPYVYRQPSPLMRSLAIALWPLCVIGGLVMWAWNWLTKP
jgi:hypothetical protein